MLAPDSRAVLLDLLRPPPGYELAQAVATTFTLDLSAALIPPLAFVARGLSRSVDPLSLLAATRAVTGKIDIFCQAGQIGVPRSPSRLIDFVAPMVHPVGEPRPGRLFHAKVWLMKFAGDDGDRRYRLIVPSRNLTNDASWDIVLSLNGEPGTRRLASNRPLVTLLASLPERCIGPLATKRAERVKELAEEIRTVEWELPDGARDMAFHVLGVRAAGARPDFSGYRHLLVSPFLTGGGLDRVVNGRRQDVTVISRGPSLDGLEPADVAGIRSFVINPLADIAPAADGPVDGAGDGPATQDQKALGSAHTLGALHAKLLVIERARLAHLFAGSLNVTDAAFTGNVEIMVELVGSPAVYGVDALLGDDAMGPLLEPYEAAEGTESDPADKDQYRLEMFLRSVAGATLVADVTVSSDGYRVRYHRSEAIALPEGYQLSVEMYTRPGDAARVVGSDVIDAEFGPMPLADVTPFLTVWVRTDGGLTGGTVLMADLRGDPPERLDEILAQQLSTPEKFLQFLAQLLGLEYAALVGTTVRGVGSKGGAAAGGGSPAVFELLVRALADKPEALEVLSGLIPRLAAGNDARGSSPLPDGFGELWAEVDRARHMVAGGRS